MHARKTSIIVKYIAFFLYKMVPLFAIYSATFFRHEIDCEQPLILFRFNEGNKRVREGHAVRASPVPRL